MGDPSGVLMSSVMRRALMTALTLSVIAMLTACGAQRATPLSASSTSTSLSPRCSLREGPGGQNWVNTIPGDNAASFAVATSQLSFQARMPKGLGDPSKVVMQPGVNQKGEPEHGGLILRFDTSSYGVVFVHETPWQGPANFSQWVLDTVAAGSNLPCGSTSDSATIKNGLAALLLHDPGQPDSHPSLLWLEGGVRFELSGPTLTRNQLVMIANNS